MPSPVLISRAQEVTRLGGRLDEDLSEPVEQILVFVVRQAGQWARLVQRIQCRLTGLPAGRLSDRTRKRRLVGSSVRVM
jgi:hypothetical protein